MAEGAEFEMRYVLDPVVTVPGGPYARVGAQLGHPVGAHSGASGDGDVADTGRQPRGGDPAQDGTVAVAVEGDPAAPGRPRSIALRRTAPLSARIAVAASTPSPSGAR